MKVDDTRVDETGKLKLAEGLYVIDQFGMENEEYPIWETYVHQQPNGKWIYFYCTESSVNMIGDDGLYDTLEECIEAYQDDKDAWN